MSTTRKMIGRPAWWRIGVAVLAMGLALMLVRFAWAEDKDWTTGASYSFSSKYLWRGMIQTGGNLVLQPSAWFSSRGLTLSYWGNQDLGGMAKFSELDLGLDYAVKAWDKGTINVGLVNYWYPGGDPANLNAGVATEAYAAFALILPSNPKLVVYQDLAKSSLYASFQLSQSLPNLIKFGESGGLGLTASAALGLGSAGHNTAYYPDAAGAAVARTWGLTDGAVTLSLPVTLGMVTITPAGSYTLDFKGVNGGQLFGGLTVSCTY